MTSRREIASRMPDALSSICSRTGAGAGTVADSPLVSGDEENRGVQWAVGYADYEIGDRY